MPAVQPVGVVHLLLVACTLASNMKGVFTQEREMLLGKDASKAVMHYGNKKFRKGAALWPAIVICYKHRNTAL